MSLLKLSIQHFINIPQNYKSISLFNSLKMSTNWFYRQKLTAFIIIINYSSTLFDNNKYTFLFISKEYYKL